MTSPIYKIVFDGEHSYYREGRSDKDHPIMTIEDAEYWAGELLAGHRLEQDALIIDIVNIETGEGTYLANAVTERGRDGSARAWATRILTDRAAAEAWLAKISI